MVGGCGDKGYALGQSTLFLPSSPSASPLTENIPIPSSYWKVDVNGTLFSAVGCVLDLESPEHTIIARSSPSDLDTNGLSVPDEVD